MSRTPITSVQSFLAKFKLFQHPFRLLLVLVWEYLLIWTTLSYQQPTSAQVVNVIHAVLALLTLFYPRACPLICFVLLQVTDYVFGGYDNECGLYGVLFSLGILSYETNDLYALGLALEISLSQAAETTLFNGPGYNFRAYPVFVIMFMLVAMFGTALRKHEEKAQAQWAAERAQYDNARLKRDAEIVSQMHDAVTSDLSLASLQAQQQMLDENNPDAAQWKQTNDHIVSALQNVHHVIDYIKGGDHADQVAQSGQDADLVCRIRQEMEHNGKALESMRFKGTSQVSVLESPADVDADLSAIIIRLIKEVYANISRHATCDDEYNVSVLVKRASIEITEVNDHHAETQENLPGGHGLSQLSDELAAYGGQIYTTQEHGRWEFYAFVPLTRAGL